MKNTRIALVGCGFVADYYVGTMRAHPELEIAGVMDCDVLRSAHFAAHYKLPAYSSFEAVLSDPSISIVANLTNPRSHYEVSRRCLEAGKHVYSEKPLALRLSEAEHLVDLAQRKGLYITSAPCSALSETAQTIWQALRQNEIGEVLTVRAELDDGFIATSRYQQWKSRSGTPWPWQDELTVGCTFEHAAYYLTWLANFFGRAESVTAFSSCSMREKWMADGVEDPGPDSSVACVRYESGVVARLTCSITAPLDRSLTIIGKEGVLRIDDSWDYRSPIYIQRRNFFSRVAGKYPFVTKLPVVGERRLPLLDGPGANSYRQTHKMDFARGVAELAEAIAEGRECRMSAQFCLHVNELVLAIHNAGSEGTTYRVRSSFEAMKPMPWVPSLGERKKAEVTREEKAYTAGLGQ
jgi:predicted dehydrogenase